MVAIVSKPSTPSRIHWVKPYTVRLLVTDIAVVIGAVLLAHYVRFGQPALPDSGYGKRLTAFSMVFILLWLSALEIFRTRSPRIIGSGIEEYRYVIAASFWTFGAVAIASLLFKLDPARGYLVVALPVGTLGLVVGRHLWRRYLARQRANGRYETAVLAIGDRRAVSVLAREMTRRHKDGFRVIGVAIPGYGDPRGETIEANDQQIPIVGDEVRALAAIKDSSADTVVITGTEHFGVEGIRSLLWELEALKIDLVVSPGVIDVTGQRLHVRPMSGYPLIHIEKPTYQGASRFEKRLFDFCFALAALALTSLILLVAAIAIKLTSPGPVFYAAERVGLDGRTFTMLKLRTMVADADSKLDGLLNLNESVGAVLFKMRDDPRVTSVGKILRRFSIDELPQFINVLKQEMSVVGPRPPLRREVNTYDGEVKRRLLVRPGITGLWQVSGRSNLSWDESVRLDLSYVENWSMISDLVIILKTLRAVLMRHGAY